MSDNKSRLVCVVGDDYGVVLWAYGDAAAAMDEAYGWDLFGWPTGTLPPDGMRNRVVTWEGLLDHDDDDRPYMDGKWREATYEELLSLSPIHRKQAHIPRYEVMPDGWRIDRTWGSAVHGYVPICDGVSPLKGGRKGLLRLQL